MTSIQTRTLLICLALLVTIALGVVIRWFLAGTVLVDIPFKHLRHAHSHLGIFGVLFPLAWIVWSRRGAWSPTWPWRLVYWLFTVLAIEGFLRSAYAVDAIIGSTGVLGVWLVSAWRNRRLVLSRSWLGSGPLAIVLASMAIVPVALYNRHNPAFALSWVETFLGMLILGVIVPTALGGKREGPPALLWVLLSALTALQLGVLPAWWTGLGTVGLAVTMVWQTLRAPPAWDVRLAWLALAGGLVLVGTQVVPLTHNVAVGALHFLLLGPVLLSLAPSGFRAWPALWLRLLVLAAAAGMSGALVMAGLSVPGPWLTLAAVAGSGIAAWWSVLALVEVARRVVENGTR